jgi:hypothetical protein
VQAAQHHAGCGAAENSEEGKILQVHDDKGRDAHGCAQFAECKLPAKRTEECEEGAIREEQAASVYQAGDTAFVDRSNWIQAGLL